MGFRNIMPATVAALLLSGCASIPADRGAAQVDQWLAPRGGESFAAAVRTADEQRLARTEEWLRAPVDADTAVRIALLNSPRMQQLYAELGIAQVEAYNATRLSNPSLGYERLAGGGAVQSTWSLSQGFMELLFAGYRRRVGAMELLRMQQRMAHEVLALEADVRSAWYAHATARQTLRLYSGSARAAQIAAQLADRYHEAGNISALQQGREQADSSIARLTLQKQRAAAVAARARLLEKMGVTDRADIVVREQLPLPLAMQEAAAELQVLALRQRLDIAALRTAGEMLQRQRSHARRWHLIDGVRVEAKRERDTDGAVLNGGGISMELPVFNAGGGKVLRAQAASEAAAAEIRAAELAARRDVISHHAALVAADQRVSEYRARLLPLRARNVELSQQQVNYMLLGTFDLISARRAEIDAWASCIEALGDYWQARVSLARAVGGQLPESAATTAVLELPAMPGMNEAGELP